MWISFNHGEKRKKRIVFLVMAVRRRRVNQNAGRLSIVAMVDQAFEKQGSEP